MASPNALTRQQKVKGGVWAVAFAAVIMVGTLTGAQLKSDKQKEQVSKIFSCALRPFVFSFVRS